LRAVTMAPAFMNLRGEIALPYLLSTAHRMMMLEAAPRASKTTLLMTRRKGPAER